MALYDSFFWVAHWLIFNESISKSKDVGNKIGILNIIKSVSSLITPIIGALFLIFFNKNYLITLSIVLFLCSLYPLFKLSDKFLVSKKKKNVFQMLKNKESRQSFFLISLYGVHYQIEEIILPIFIFITFSSIETVSFLPIVLAIGSIIFNMFIGKFVDKHEKFKIIIFGALCLGIVWVIRIFFPIIEIFILSAIFVGFFTNMIFVSTESRLIKASRTASFLDVSTFRNTAYMWLNFPLFLIMFISVEMFKVSFVISMASMFCLVIISQIYLRNKIKIEKELFGNKKIV